MGNPNPGSQADQRLRSIIKLAKNRRCADCNNQYFGRMKDVRRNKMTDTMTFDHLPQNKRSFDIGWVSRVGASSKVTVAQLKAEIAKCDIVCWSCHKKRERKRNEEHEEKVLQQNDQKKEALIIAAALKPFQDVYREYQKHKQRKLRKKEFVKRAEMKIALVQLLEWLVSFGPIESIEPQVKTISPRQQEKNLREFALSMSLSYMWLEKRAKEASMANSLDQLMSGIHTSLPDATIINTSPDPNGLSQFIEVHLPGKVIAVEWRLNEGFLIGAGPTYQPDPRIVKSVSEALQRVQVAIKIGAPPT